MSERSEDWGREAVVTLRAMGGFRDLPWDGDTRTNEREARRQALRTLRGEPVVGVCFSYSDFLLSE